MTEVAGSAVFDEPLPSLDGVAGEFDAVSWRAPFGIGYEEWHRIGEVFKERRRVRERNVSRDAWYLADWFNAGELLFADAMAQALDATDYSKESLNDIARVGRAYPPSERQHPDRVTFWTHDEAISLPEAERFELMRRAAEEGMSRKQVRAVAAEKRKKNGEDGQETIPGIEGDEEMVTCPLCKGASTVTPDQERAYLMEEVKM